ncbi:MAG: hypothetical protein J6V52_00035 [Bacteroidaceae bacterium]|nr:hypothetical protein [Bacteroidaceae bacterium]
MKDDLIRRDDLKEELHSWAICLNRPSCYSKDDADYIIDYMPAVDAVEVVRCRDCKHTRERDEDEKNYLVEGVLICTSIDATNDCSNAVWPDHFCSYGERREDDGA